MFEATLYGVGIILGAGVYALIGVGAGLAGNALWLSFLLGAFIAAFTGLSYAELASLYPKEAAEYVYAQHAFRRKVISFLVEWVVIFAGIVSATAVALGFAGYFSHLFGGSILLIAALVIILFSFLNYFGIKESAKYNNIATMVEVLGLVLVILVGFYYLPQVDFGEINFFSSPQGITSVISATALIFFAFIGFENVVNISEETKKAKKIIPQAVLLSLGISAVLYLLVSLAAISTLGAEGLASSPAPLASVVGKVIPGASLVVSLIALFATSNTVLISLITTSRLFYGLSCNRVLPKIFSFVGRRGTPYFSVLAVGLLTLLGLTIGGIKEVASLTDVGIFLVYFTVNLSVIVLRYQEPDLPRGYKAPFNLGKFPVTAFLGLASSLFMLFYFEPKLLWYELILIAVGMVVYFFFRFGRGRK